MTKEQIRIEIEKMLSESIRLEFMGNTKMELRDDTLKYLGESNAYRRVLDLFNEKEVN